MKCISRRNGATLTEVLIAILILSIGLIAVAVLFPVSIMQSIRGAQLTSATDARYNAEAATEIFPKLIRDPAFAFPTATSTPAAYWGTKFIVDPLGYAEVPAASAALAPYFGNDPALPLPPAAGSWTFLKRYQGTWQSEAAADYLVTMPDSWTLEFEGTMTAGTAQIAPAAAGGVTQVDVKGLGATGFAIPAGIQARAVMFGADGRTSHARMLTQITGDAIFWSENANGVDANGNGILDDHPLPTAFIPNPVPAGFQLGKIRIEYQERRYTWLLTVRMDQGGSPDVDVVVFFKRKFDPSVDERLYQANFLAGQNFIDVNYAAGSAPGLSKGRYAFDAVNARWYRISNVFANGSTQSRVYLETPAAETNVGILDPNNPPNTLTPYAMFPRNVVDVYPIGPKGKN